MIYAFRGIGQQPSRKFQGRNYRNSYPQKASNSDNYSIVDNILATAHL
jgi:hypothetical protein